MLDSQRVNGWMAKAQVICLCPEEEMRECTGRVRVWHEADLDASTTDLLVGPKRVTFHPVSSEGAGWHTSLHPEPPVREVEVKRMAWRPSSSLVSTPGVGARKPHCQRALPVMLGHTHPENLQSSAGPHSCPGALWPGVSHGMLPCRGRAPSTTEQPWVPRDQQQASRATAHEFCTFHHPLTS